MSKTNVTLIEAVLNGIVSELDVTPKEMLIAVKNTFYHGGKYMADWDFDDKFLGAIHDALETAIEEADNV